MDEIRKLMPDKFRFWFYIAFSLAILARGAALEGFDEAGMAAPMWFNVTSSVVLYVGAAFGFTAAAHTPRPGKHRDE